MNPKEESIQELKKQLETDYPLIPMKDITDEARLIAVAWMEEDDRKFIANKHKLASDIMNYARRSSQLKDKRIKELETDNAKYVGIAHAMGEAGEKIVALEKEIDRLKTIIFNQFSFYHEEAEAQKQLLWGEFKNNHNL